METLNLYDDTEFTPKLARTYSFPTLRSLDPTNTEYTEEPESMSSSGSSLSSSISSSVERPTIETTRDLYKRNTRSMYGNNTEYEPKDSFDQRQKEISILVTSLKKDLDKFKDSLEKSEDLVHDVQVDMDDTRNRMETYIKDIPESHYSAVSNYYYLSIVCALIFL